MAMSNERHPSDLSVQDDSTDNYTLHSKGHLILVSVISPVLISQSTEHSSNQPWPVVLGTAPPGI